uniref:DNA2/NAM7 helicase-like C-terminal domain-containing protein n=1 Tax=Acrobeloides nanus TaxID=290746 RepID=A0A914ED07_9BILA
MSSINLLKEIAATASSPSGERYTKRGEGYYTDSDGSETETEEMFDKGQQLIGALSKVASKSKESLSEKENLHNRSNSLNLLAKSSSLQSIMTSSSERNALRDRELEELLMEIYINDPHYYSKDKLLQIRARVAILQEESKNRDLIVRCPELSKDYIAPPEPEEPNMQRNFTMRSRRAYDSDSDENDANSGANILDQRKTFYGKNASPEAIPQFKPNPFLMAIKNQASAEPQKSESREFPRRSFPSKFESSRASSRGQFSSTRVSFHSNDSNEETRYGPPPKLLNFADTRFTQNYARNAEASRPRRGRGAALDADNKRPLVKTNEFGSRVFVNSNLVAVASSLPPLKRSLTVQKPAPPKPLADLFIKQSYSSSRGHSRGRGNFRSSLTFRRTPQVQRMHDDTKKLPTSLAQFKQTHMDAIDYLMDYYSSLDFSDMNNAVISCQQINKSFNSELGNVECYNFMVTIRFKDMENVAAETFSVLKLNSVVELKYLKKIGRFRILMKIHPRSQGDSFSITLGQLEPITESLNLPAFDTMIPAGQLKVRRTFDREHELLLNSLLDAKPHALDPKHFYQKKPIDVTNFLKSFWHNESSKQEVLPQEKHVIISSVDRIKQSLNLQKPQVDALQMALMEGLSFVAGTPGTGKTTVTACIAIAGSVLLNGKVLCVAPNESSARVCAEAIQSIFQLYSHHNQGFPKREINVMCLYEYSHISRISNEFANKLYDVVVTTSFYAIQNFIDDFLPTHVVFDDTAEFNIGQVAAVLNKSRRADINGSKSIGSVVLLGDIYGVEPHVDPELASNEELYEAMRTSALTLASRNNSINRIQLPFQVSFRGFPTNYNIDTNILHFNLESPYGDHQRISVVIKDEVLKKTAIWFNVKGREIAHTYTYSNEEEVNAVITLVKSLRDSRNYDAKLPHEICVTTFFDDQKWKIIGKLRDANCLAHVTVKTVDELDGTEFQVVIVSLVRTQEAGILNGSSIILHKKIHCNGLLKVALTRAKSALYIVGNLKAVEKFGGDIGELAKYCKNKELVSDILK